MPFDSVFRFCRGGSLRCADRHGGGFQREDAARNSGAGRGSRCRRRAAHARALPAAWFRRFVHDVAEHHRPASAGRRLRDDRRLPRRREQLVLGQSPRSGVAVRDLRGAGTARLDRRPLPDDSFARGPRRHGLEYGRSRRAVGSAAPQRPFRGCGIDLGRRGHPAFPRLVGDEETVGRTERQSGTLERAYGDPSGRFAPGRRTGAHLRLRLSGFLLSGESEPPRTADAAGRGARFPGASRCAQRGLLVRVAPLPDAFLSALVRPECAPAGRDGLGAACGVYRRLDHRR